MIHQTSCNCCMYLFVHFITIFCDLKPFNRNQFDKFMRSFRCQKTHLSLLSIHICIIAFRAIIVRNSAKRIHNMYYTLYRVCLVCCTKMQENLHCTLHVAGLFGFLCKLRCSSTCIHTIYAFDIHNYLCHFVVIVNYISNVCIEDKLGHVDTHIQQ